MATIGQVLTAPEAGTKRYDNTNICFLYKGSWATQSNAAYYNSTLTYSNVSGATIEFKFKGTSIRIVGQKNTDKVTPMSITIDGVEETYSCSGALANQVLLYEKTGLTDDIHLVIIKVTGTNEYQSFDAIDIESTGRLLHPNEVTTIEELAVGKRIRANFRAGTSGVLGRISRIGEETGNFIPAASSATPDGDFYFLMFEDWNGQKRLMADRNIQTGTTWDHLNGEGVASGSGVKIPTVLWNHNDKSGSVVLPNTGGGLTAQVDWRDMVRTTKGRTSGKWYWEVTVDGGLGGGAGINEYMIGIVNAAQSFSSDVSATGNANLRLYTGQTGNKFPENVAYGASYAAGAVISVLLDIDSGTLEFWKDGVSQGVAHTDIKSMGEVFPTLANGSGTTETATYTANFGYKPFKHNKPSRFKAYDDLQESNQITLRLPTGGHSASDPDCEWHKYIVSSTLEGTITAGDNAVWNWSGLYSVTSTTPSSGNSLRIVRGNSAVTSSGSGSTTNTTYGFRPVLTIETLILPFVTKYLIEDGTDIKTYNNETWSIVGQSPATSEMFENGITNLNLLTDTAINQLISSTPKLLIYASPDSGELNTQITAVPKEKLILPTGDFDLMHVEMIDWINLSANQSGLSELKVIVSIDSGVTWKSWDDTLGWINVNLTMSDVKSKGMTVDQLNSKTFSEWNELFSGGFIKVRFGYYFELDSSSDTLETDLIEFKFDMKGIWHMAVPETQYSYAYTKNDTLTVKLLADGTYKINYTK